MENSIGSHLNSGKKHPRLISRVFIKNTDDEVCLIQEKRFKDGEEKIQWSIPGGEIEPHEKLIEGALREVKEETNLNIKVTKLLAIIEWEKPNLEIQGQHKGHFGIDFIFGADLIDGMATPQTEENIIQVKFFPLSKLSDLISNSKYLDLISSFLGDKGLKVGNPIKNSNYEHIQEFT